jgi:hypothetical protein
MGMTPETLAELKQLGELRDSGILSQEEFEAEKQRIMNPPVALLDISEEVEVEAVDESTNQFVGDSSFTSESRRIQFFIDATSVFQNSGISFSMLQGMLVLVVRTLISEFKIAMSKGPQWAVVFLARCVLCLSTYGISELILLVIWRSRNKQIIADWHASRS